MFLKRPEIKGYNSNRLKLTKRTWKSIFISPLAVTTVLGMLNAPAFAVEVDINTAEATAQDFGSFCLIRATVNINGTTRDDPFAPLDYFHIVTLGNGVELSSTPSELLSFAGGEFLTRFSATDVATQDLDASEGPYLYRVYETTERGSTSTDDLVAEIEIPQEVLLTAGGKCETVGTYSLNTAPIADAGDDILKVKPNQLVNLDGSRSFDADFDALAYNWRQVSGPTVDLRDPNSATPHFFYPPGRADRVIKFELTVYDGSASSDADTVQVIHNGRSNGQGRGK